MFNPNNELNLSSLLSTIKSKLGKGYGNERSQLNQLKATLKEWINIQHLKSFLNDRIDLIDFYKKDFKKISKHKILTAQPDDDFLNIITERTYDIRCKIVHTKSIEADENMEILLPFSKEAQLMFCDLELIKYLSQQVIIYNGKEFTI
jgi:hypothetical protein